MCAFTIYISIARKYVTFSMRQFKIFNRYHAWIIVLLRMSILQLYDCGRSILRQSAAENDLYENQFTNMSCQKMLLFIVDYETERLLIKAILNTIEIILYYETCLGGNDMNYIDNICIILYHNCFCLFLQFYTTYWKGL